MKNKVICMFCGSEKIRGIIYGEIGFRDDNDVIEFDARFVSRDVKTNGDDPIFHCDGCGKDFGKIIKNEGMPDRENRKSSNIYNN